VTASDIVVVILVFLFIIGWVFGDYAISRNVGIGPIDLVRIILRKLNKRRRQ